MGGPICSCGSSEAPRQITALWGLGPKSRESRGAPHCRVWRYMERVDRLSCTSLFKSISSKATCMTMGGGQPSRYSESKQVFQLLLQDAPGCRPLHLGGRPYSDEMVHTLLTKSFS